MGTNLLQGGRYAEEKIIDKFVVELKRYYGEPYDADKAEDSYSWHWKNSGQFIRARHLHADEGDGDGRFSCTPDNFDYAEYVAI